MRSSSPNDRSLLDRARNLPPREWLDLTVAIFELGLARLRLRRIDPRSVIGRETTAPDPVHAHAGTDVRVERIRKAVARASHRLPWRADCLVQALAAQRWLRRYGIASRIMIGAHERGLDPFEAHAWLTCGDVIVTGGDVGGYTPLQAPKR